MSQRLDWISGLTQKRARDIRLNRDLVDGVSLNSNSYGQNAVDSLAKRLWDRVRTDSGITLSLRHEGYDSMLHYDILSPEFKTLKGMYTSKPFKPFIIDSSDRAVNMYKNTLEKEVEARISMNIIQPMRAAIAQREMARLGVTDPVRLQHDDQVELSNHIASVLEKSLPKDLSKKLDDPFPAYQSDTWSKLLDIAIGHYGLKSKFEDACDIFMAAGFVMQFSSIRSGEFTTFLCNPEGCAFDETHNDHDLSKGWWWTYEDSISLPNLIREHRLTPDMLNDILVGEASRFEGSHPIVRATNNFLSSPDYAMFRDAKFNLNTNEGSREYLGFLSNYYGGTINTTTYLRKHYAFIGMDLGMKVSRINKTTGLIEDHWRTEEYELNHAAGDVDVKLYIIPRYYEATLINNHYWIEKGPSYYCYRGLDVFNPIAPYSGVRWKLPKSGSLRPVSPVDLVVNDQFEYNKIKDKINHLEDVSIGNVVTVPSDPLPDNMTPEEQFREAKYTQLLRVRSRGEGGTQLGAELQYLYKSIRMSNLDDAQYCQLRGDIIKRDVMIRLGTYGRSGGMSPYETARQTDAKEQASGIQMSDVISKLDRFTESVLNNVVWKLYRHSMYTNNLSHFGLDETNLALLGIGRDSIAGSNPHVRIIMDQSEWAEIGRVKDNMLNILQNLDEADEALNLAGTNSMSEIRKIAFRIKSRRDELANAERAARVDEIKAKAEQQRLLAELNGEITILKERIRGANGVQMAIEANKRFAEQWDIDRNAISDANQRTAMELRHKEKLLEEEQRQFDEEMDFKRKELQFNRAQKGVKK